MPRLPTETRPREEDTDDGDLAELAQDLRTEPNPSSYHTAPGVSAAAGAGAAMIPAAEARRSPWRAALLTLVLAAGVALAFPPAAHAQTEVWSSTLTVGEYSVSNVLLFRGYRSALSFGSLADDDFDLLGTSFTVLTLVIASPNGDNKLRLVFDTAPGAHTSFLTLHLGSASFPLAAADFDSTQPTYFEWTGHGLTWADSDTVQARLTFQAPDPVACTGVDNCYEVPAAWEFTPFGLTPGDTFRLLFLTSTSRDATSSDIADYNTHVQTAAAGHLFIQPYNSHFTALGSTPATDARDNTATTTTADDTGVPIYWLGGDKVADDYADFYDRSWDSGKVRDESGSLVSVPDGDTLWVWTGSNNDGTEHLDSNAKSQALGNSETGNQVRRGAVHPLINQDLTSDPLDAGALPASTSSPFYALSPVFKVAAAPPDPVSSCTGVDNCYEVLTTWGLTPSGITAGTSFRLFFLTSTSRDATSSDIADYNTHVQTAAAAGHLFIQPYNSHFTALGSTPATDARDNTATTTTADDTGVPIYWLGGDKVADDYADFYDTSWDSGKVRDESGSLVSVPSGNTQWAWTGSNDDGTEYIGTTDTKSYALGNSETHNQTRTGTVHTLVNQGNPNDPLDAGAQSRTNSYPFYALSPVFRAVTALSNPLPVFSDTAPVARSVPENSPSATHVGAPVAATYPDPDVTMVYRLGGPDAASFTMITISGQIGTRAGVTYDHETRSR